MSTAARPRPYWFFALLCCASADCQALDDEARGECTLQSTYEATFAAQSGDGCVPQTQALHVKAPETFETFLDTKVETVTDHEGCQVQLMVTTRDRFTDVPISQLTGSVVPQPDGTLGGLLTFITFDARGTTITCVATVSVRLAPWFESLGASATAMPR